MFFQCFSFSLVLFDCNCAKCKYGATMIWPGLGSLVRNLHRVSGDQQDSVYSAGQLGLAWARNLQFGCTTLQAWTCNCSHCISCDNQNITNFKEKLLKKLPKIFNYQKSQKNREILPKVIKITKSGHTALLLGNRL